MESGSGLIDPNAWFTFPTQFRIIRPRYGFAWAQVAQLVEHFLGKEEVTDSSSVLGSTRRAARGSSLVAGHSLSRLVP